MKVLQQEHLSQEVEDDSMKLIPDNIDFSMEPAPAGKDETDRQSSSSRPLSPLKPAILSPLKPAILSPLKPAIPAKPNLGILAARRLPQAGNQKVLSNDQNTSLPTGNHETVNQEEKPLSIPVFDPDTPSLPMSTPLSSMEVLSHRY